MHPFPLYANPLCLPGYLSSPHVGQEPPYSRDAQPVITSPVVPSPSSGKISIHGMFLSCWHWQCLFSVLLLNEVHGTTYNLVNYFAASPTDSDSYAAKCPSGGQCNRLPADCINCSYHHNCSYGKLASFSCKAKRGVHCTVSSFRQLDTDCSWQRTRSSIYKEST